MASRPRIPKGEITGLYGWALKGFSRKLLGEIPEPSKACKLPLAQPSAVHTTPA